MFTEVAEWLIFICWAWSASLLEQSGNSSCAKRILIINFFYCGKKLKFDTVEAFNISVYSTIYPTVDF